MHSTQEDRIVLIDLHYLPCIAYFSRIFHADKVLVEVNEHYVKQTYRNRCYIQIANKIHVLTVPVSRGTGKVRTKDVRISYHQKWQDNHWRTIASAYGNAPFFDFFAEEFHDILYKNYHFLIDLNLDLLSKCLELLDMNDKDIMTTDTFQKDPENQVADYRSLIKPKTMCGYDSFFAPQSYNQVFGKDFVPNLSVIDLLFCEGSRAKYIISQSLS